MQLDFLGTRGNIRIRSKAHHNHAALLIVHNNKRIMIDCGKDYAQNIGTINPDALLITHAHPDHVGGLINGIDCPVYCTLDTWYVMKKYPIIDKRIITPELPIIIEGLTIVAYRVLHALNTPTVGYRISDGKHTIFYASDLVKIHHEADALHNVDLYIGDGAIIKRTLLVKKRGATFIGHAPLIAQMQWCKRRQVPAMIVTHCGTEIVSQDTATHSLALIIEQLGQQYGIQTALAYDGLRIML